jgi:bifunctional DNA-binding transcriptional regulator/antitoxin component of YhaV-PrlF toxin-antitoxin module
MTSLITITSKNQVTLPIKFTRQLGLKPGMRLMVHLSDTGFHMEKVPRGLKDMQGIVQAKAKYPRLTVLQATKRARLNVAKRLLHS